MGLDMETKKLLTQETAKRYVQSEKKEKNKILDEFIATTGYNRKYAITTLNTHAELKITNYNNVRKESATLLKKVRKKRIYRPFYGNDVQKEIIKLWQFSLYLCSKRLVVFIRDNIEYLGTKFNYSLELKTKLGSISSATIGRILKPEINKALLRGISTTRPATNLNKLIPIRVFFNWDEKKPGFFECDTVAHCGMSSAGEYLSTLTLTDVHSGWTETRALRNKAHRWVKEACEDVKQTIPFDMKGIDSDNGSEFKNTQMVDWCRENTIAFTRSRPYKKNDNCFVEQKNDSVVRRIVGYYRFEGEEACTVLAELYDCYNKLVNYFFPSMKIMSKERVDAKVIKKYDTAKTPYTRLLECTELEESVKVELARRKQSFDLQALLSLTHELQSELITLAKPWSK